MITETCLNKGVNYHIYYRHQRKYAFCIK